MERDGDADGENPPSCATGIAIAGIPASRKGKRRFMMWGGITTAPVFAIDER